MHASFRIGETELMASDGMNSGKPVFAGFCLSVAATDEADAKRKFAALATGGQVQQPLTKTFFSECFGMVQDKFGVGWMVIVPA
jgi:PhnB protein